MKKLGLLFKETSENRIKNNLKDSKNVFVVKHAGVTSPDLCSLRLALRHTNAKLFVVKNSVARRALKDSSLEDLIKLIDGPCSLVFVKEELADTCRILYDFSREHEQLKLEGGFLEDKILAQKDIETLAKLPPKAVLRVLVVLALKAPISGLAMALNQVLLKFVYCIDQIKNKRGGENG